MYQRLSKKLLFEAFLGMSVPLSAQSLYVQPIDGGEQVEFTFASKPEVTYSAEKRALVIDTLNAETPDTIGIAKIQNLSFVKKITQGTGIATTTVDESISVYPNPVKDELVLSLQRPVQGLTYRIFDLIGSELKSEPIRSEITLILMDSFHTGVYVLQIEKNGQNLKSFKII